MRRAIKILSGSSHNEFALEVCQIMGLELCKSRTIKFSNDNMMPRIEENVRETDVFVIQTSTPPVSDNIIELLLMLDALKYASAGRITAVLPYFPYVRSDKKDQPRISIAARLMGHLIETAGASRLLTMNLHASQIQGFFDIPSDQLFATNIICQYFSQRDLSNYVIVAADVGESKHIGHYANILNLPIAIIDKRRQGNSDSIIPTTLIGDVVKKDCLIVDDEVSSGGTLTGATKFLMKNGAKSVSAAIVHGVLSGQAMAKIEASPLKELVITNSVPLPKQGYISPKIKVLSIAPLFAQAISHIHSGMSVSLLFAKDYVHQE
ncbi:MAG: ribose-phosphate diphosphokinase [SAR324 cluster bacterium]|nr:ribose-phosphate diphosphokinase [SAR324 cluster bacterium]